MAATEAKPADLDEAVEATVAAARRGESQKGGAGAPGSRLADAFEAVERFPVLVASRERVIGAATGDQPRVSELVEAVESDVSLTISVLRFANRSGLVAGGVAGIPDAVEVLKPSGVLAIAGTAPSFDFFESNGGWELKPERFRVHALATQRAADQIGRIVGWVERDELAVAALLHDVGRLVISRLHPGYKVYFDSITRTPEQRLRDERDQLGIDHTLVGGVLARRWNLPSRIAVAIERHHADDADGLAAMVATADMIAHYSQGEAIAPERLYAAAEACGLGREQVRELLYELPLPRQDASRISEPCPLSSRELDVLRHLSEGMVYKQIASEMHLSVSTIRTHLHNVYGKIGAVDRAQAVLLARDRGWI
ncbi:MAG TPA: HDOD domain-containing protein [Solirubrobacterales bacterium]|nr:HDOD domain-containing protein [Solirubrobacterales bacterium]